MNRGILDNLIRKHNRIADLVFLTLAIACTALIIAILALVK
jgi:hypothetical protein